MNADGPPPANVHQALAHQCARCGAESDNEDAYQVVKTGRGRKSTRCLPCTRLEAQTDNLRTWRWILAGGLVSFGILSLAHDSVLRGFAWWFINFAVLPMLLLVPTVVGHELGHWGMARALGLQVHGVQIGSGPAIWSGRWGDVRLHWRRHLILDEIRVSLPGRTLARSRFALMIAAGPATHLLWIAAAFGLAHSFGVLGDGFWGVGPTLDRLNPLVSVVFLNALDFVLNIVPSRIGGRTTDGALLLATPFLKREQIDELIEAQWTAPAELALTNGDFEHADQILQTGLRSAPDSLPLSFLRAVYNVMTGEVERAVLILRPLHVRAHDDPTMRAIVANSLAWSLCLIDDPADREERDALVREAKRQLGEQPAVLSTWGATLLADGRPSEAWPILSNALSKVDEKDQRATVLCNLARAEHQLGLSQQARDRIVEARALNPLNQLLERTERELAQQPRVDTRPRSLPPGTLELSPTSCDEPMPTRARIPRWLWVGVPVSLFLWSCVPPYVESALTMGVPYHDLARGPASVEEQASCAEGLVTLRRWDWLLSRLPSHQGGLPSWREHQVAQLQACTGDLEQAHETLSRLIAQTMATVDPAELGAEIAGDTGEAWERYAAALSALESQLSLAHVEERLGRIEAATATLERAERFAGRIDRTGSERPQFGSRSRVARLVAELIQRREGPEAALARIQQILGRVEGEFPEAALTSLLSLQAELLERLGRTQEADAVFSRIGRATRDSYAMGSSSD